MKKSSLFAIVLVLLLGGESSALNTRGKAVMRSALLPGWGQIHLGHETRGLVFVGVDLATWAGVGLSYLEGVFKRDDYTWLASSQAGIFVEGRSRDFLDDLSNFDSSTEYNDYVHRLARYYYPDDPEAQRKYYETHARYGDDAWDWSSEEARVTFARHLQDSRQWFRRSLYIAAFALVNRVVSIIDVSLLKEADTGMYTSLNFPDRRDFSSFRFVVGARF